MEKKVFISQSNYIPWKGFFDNIGQSDVYVIYDEMQYTKNDWRNRNKIKTQNGLQWLTIPVQSDSLKKKISETHAVDNRWINKHLKTIQQSYTKARYGKEVLFFLEEIYTSIDSSCLSEINIKFIKAICQYLGIKTQFVTSNELTLKGDRTTKLVGICKELGATTYQSSPVAQDYLDESAFEKENIKLTYFDYSSYPVYEQLYGTFEHYVSIIDLLFNEGPNAPNYMKFKL